MSAQHFLPAKSVSRSSNPSDLDQTMTTNPRLTLRNEAYEGLTGYWRLLCGLDEERSEWIAIRRAIQRSESASGYGGGASYACEYEEEEPKPDKKPVSVWEGVRIHLEVYTTSSLRLGMGEGGREEWEIACASLAQVASSSKPECVRVVCAGIKCARWAPEELL
ncbi:hypothetical protein BDQ17DRAFT_1336627 [Cyathus striatus]|nr:hypothetical protein BDQ17DRAFT_1336627 [Cyathus striatus]